MHGIILKSTAKNKNENHLFRIPAWKQLDSAKQTSLYATFTALSNHYLDSLPLQAIYEGAGMAGGFMLPMVSCLKWPVRGWPQYPSLCGGVALELW